MHKKIGIVAMSPSRVIGNLGTLPWHLPADLAFFKRTTSGHPVVMGRTTFESIGRPLPNRRNIVLTRDPSWHAPGVETIPSPAALDLLPDLPATLFIIGGATIYEAFLPTMDELLVSQLHQEYPGDTWFPTFDHLFHLHETMERHPEFSVQRWLRNPGSPPPET